MEKQIPGIKSIYTVSSDGIVYVTRDGIKQQLKVYVNSKGYYQTHVYRTDGTALTTGVHRLVALAYIPNPENKPQVNHIDTNKLNNTVGNLEWSTQAENMQHAVDSGIYKRFRIVYKYDTEHNLLEWYDSVTEAIENNEGLTYNDLSKCLSENSPNTYAKGYYWYNAKITDIPTRSKYACKYTTISVYKDEILIGTYNDISELMRAFPEFTSKGSLSSCLSKGKSYKGYTLHRN